MLVTAKNRPPNGEAKKRPTSKAVPMVGRIALISSKGPLGSLDGGS